MRCCDVEKLWDDMRDALQPHREQVIKHLRECPPCQELYEQYEGIAYCLTCLPPPEPSSRAAHELLSFPRNRELATGNWQLFCFTIFPCPSSTTSASPSK